MTNQDVCPSLPPFYYKIAFLTTFLGLCYENHVRNGLHCYIVACNACYHTGLIGTVLHGQPCDEGDLQPQLLVVEGEHCNGIHVCNRNHIPDYRTTCKYRKRC